jgi:hypothetical protein
MRTEKFEEISFTPKAEKLELLKDYAKKNNVAFYSVVNIPTSSVPEFEKFLKENDVFDEEFERFLEDLLMFVETSFAVPAHNKALLQELKDFACRHRCHVSINGTVATATMPESILESKDFKELMLKLKQEFEKELKK